MATTTTTESKRLDGARITAFEQAIPTGETGDSILLQSRDVTVTAHPGAGGTGKVQYSTSKPSLVLSDDARWVDWAKGAVDAPASDVPEGPITAIRGVNVSGAEDLILEIVFGGRL